MAKQKTEALVTELTQKLLELAGIKAEATVTTEKDEQGDVYHVEVKTDEEAGLLIGNHGMTLSAIQSFLTLSVKNKTDEWARIVVDVAGWRAKHEEYLVSLAKQAADRAKLTHEPQYLYNLTPSQRRVIHTALAEIGGIVSESEGEGADRYLVVKTA